MKKLWSTLLASVAALAILIAPDAARADEESDRLAALGKAQTYTVKTTGPASPIDMGGAAILVNAPLAEVRKVVTKYGDYQKFLKPFDQSKVLSKRKGVSEVYLQVPILHGAARIWVVTELSAPTKRGNEEVISGRMKRGNVDDFRAVWRMRAVDAEHTVLKLELLVDPSLPFGASIVTKHLTSSAEKGIRGVKQRAEEAYAARRPASKQPVAQAPAQAQPAKVVAGAGAGAGAGVDQASAPEAAPQTQADGEKKDAAASEQAQKEGAEQAPILPEGEGGKAVKTKDVAKR